MIGEKFNLSQMSINTILNFIQAKEFTIPEIQRPFVWKRSQVRDLIDSLYNGYPTGYIIIWKNPDVRVKDGTISCGKKVLIDGQQRITALMASLVGKEVLDEDFKTDRIKIAYNPFADDDSKRFAVQDASHLKNKVWIPDISEVFSPTFGAYTFITEYVKDNPERAPEDVSNAIDRLKSLSNRMIGVIELDQSLDIDEVTEIFIRINSKGTALNQSDFVMSKMAADEENGGCMMRKAIDYFCHLAVKPEFYDIVRKDSEFKSSKYMKQIEWLAHDYDDLYDPDYGDVLRVSFMHIFGKGRMKDLVSLLSGRDFKTKEYRQEIVEESYVKLEKGLTNFFNEYNFKQFILALRGAGFISSKQLTSRMTVDFAYILYLMLHADPSFKNDEQIKRYVQKWFVLSTLIGRYVTSPESVMDRDIRMIGEKGFEKFFEEVEASELSQTFWEVGLPLKLESSSTTTPAFNAFIAAQVKMNCNSLLMHGTKVQDLVNIAGDIHHIFPKEYLKKNGYDNRGAYNQVANYIYLDSPVNKSIGKDAPCDYFGRVKEQCESGTVVLGNISDINAFYANLDENCIPHDIVCMNVDDYEVFLKKRRILMSDFIRRYYQSI